MSVTAQINSNIEYFSYLHKGGKVKDIPELKSRLHELIHDPYLSTSQKISLYWSGARCANFSSDVNVNAGHPRTPEINSIFVRQISALQTVVINSGTRLTPQDCDAFMSTFLRLQAQSSTIGLGFIVNQIRQCLHLMRPEQLRKLPEQFALLGQYPGDSWINQWWDVAKPISGEWGLKGGCALIYRLAFLDMLRGDHPDGQSDNPSPCRIISDGFFSFFTRHTRHVFDDVVDSRVYFASIWFGHTYINDFKIFPENGKGSVLESRVLSSLGSANITADGDGIIVPVINHRIDLSANFNGQAMGIEVDGIYHFDRALSDDGLRPKTIFNSSTRFQSALIERLAPEIRVLRVPHFLLPEGVGSDAEKAGLPWEKTLRRLSKNQPGVYAFQGGNQIKPMAQKAGCVFECL